MLNWALRYAPIVKFVKKYKLSSILEVGSGSQGLAYYLPHLPIVGTDINFDSPIAENLIPVLASANNLPFGNNAFDLVVSSDMLEHLPESDRRYAIEEMLRVTKKHILLGFPCGDVAEKLDRQISEELKKINITDPPWLTEHFLYQYPTIDSVTSSILKGSTVETVMGNDNCFIHKFVILGEMKPRINRFLCRMDRINLISALSPLVNVGKTYRQIMILKKN